MGFAPLGSIMVRRSWVRIEGTAMGRCVWDVLLMGYAAVEKRARNKRGVTLPDVWYGKYK
jgi:hypothetical protein